VESSDHWALLQRMPQYDYSAEESREAKYSLRYVFPRLKDGSFVGGLERECVRLCSGNATGIQ
jgi:hypothetical protein